MLLNMGKYAVNAVINQYDQKWTENMDNILKEINEMSRNLITEY